MRSTVVSVCKQFRLYFMAKNKAQEKIRTKVDQLTIDSATWRLAEILVQQIDGSSDNPNKKTLD